MKKLLCLALLAALLLPLCAAADEVRYNTTGKLSCPVYAKMDKNAKTVGRIYNGSNVKVYWLTPDWAHIYCEGMKGYVERRFLNAGKPVDDASIPPWGVEVYRYVALVGQDAAIRTAPDAQAEALITLRQGARLTLICVEDGWGKLAFRRQYGYVDTNTLAELLPVCPDAAQGTDEAPIAAFTSYYIAESDDIDVQGKETNIEVNVSYMNGDTLAPGKSMSYNDHYGSFNRAKGYTLGPVLVSGGWGLGLGGGVCQVSSTLYNVLLQLPGIDVTERRPHGPSGVAYLPLDMDAAVGAEGINLSFRNLYDFPIRFEAQAQDGALYIAVYRVTQ